MDNDKYIGRLLDNRYEILEVIGVGGMAVVYKARCHRLNRLVAVKILKDDYRQDDEFRRRFHAEGQAVAMVSHPNIVSVYDVSTSNSADYIVMELIDGISLKQYMEKKGVLNWKETLHFAIQIGKALEHAHGRGIVHRDIKPHNVMVLKNGSVKVADFGIARVMSESNTLTREALGSVHYISPEQAKGGRVDNRSDLYSLGVVMYEMMTGRPPYNGESPVAVAIQHINGGAAMPSTLNPNIPGGLEQIIMRAMAHEPDQRYDTATAMLYDMDEFRKDPTILFDYNVPPTDAVIDLNRPAAAAAAAAAAGAAAAAAPKAAPVSRNTGALRNTGSVRAAAPVSRNTGALRNTGASRPVAGTAARNTGALRNTGAVRTAPKAGEAPQAAAPRPEAGAAPVRPAAPKPTVAERAAADPARRRAAEEAKRKREQEEKQNKTTMVAIIACAAVAVIALIVFLVILIGGAFSGSERGRIEVPDFLNCNFDDTREAYRYRSDIFIKLNPDRKYSYSDQYAAGCIMDQSPAAGEMVEEGTVIYVTVSSGKETDPKYMADHAGKPEAEVRGYLEGQNLKLQVQTVPEFSDEMGAGMVIRTSPAQGELLNEGMVVTLYVSTGPEVEEKLMPDVKGKTLADAIKELDRLQLSLTVESKPQEDLTVEENTVISSYPKAGETVRTGDDVILYVSFGMKTNVMPSLVGDTEAVAREKLSTMATEMGLTIKVEEEYAEGKTLGTVVRTAPAMNEIVKTGDTVTLYICAQKQVKMPDVAGKSISEAIKLLNNQGLENIKYDTYRTGNQDKDTVLTQSVEKNKEISVDTEIELVLCSGTKTVNRSFAPMKDMTEPYTVQLKNLTTGQIVRSITVQPDATEIPVQLTGYGKMEFGLLYEEIQIGESLTITVDFDKES